MSILRPFRIQDRPAEGYTAGPGLFLLFSFISNAFLASFLFSFENQERRKKTFLLRFSFSFLMFEKKERKKAERDRAYVLSPLLLKGGKGCVLFSVG